METSISSTAEKLTPELRQSYEMIKKSEVFLEPYKKTFISEAQARELIHQTGIKTFPRPLGLLEDYRVRITEGGGGMEYVHPQHAHTSIRVMPGKPHSPNPCQQKPCVVVKIDGKYFNKLGEIVKRSDLEAHIPLEEFDLLSITRKINEH